MSAAVETPAITVSQRVDGIKANAEVMLRRMPAGWSEWKVEQTRDFKRAVSSLRKARTLMQAQSAANQLAAWYRVSVFQLDPWGALQ